MQYIDKQGVLSELQEVLNDKICPLPVAATAEQIIETYPAADVAPVVHGHWIKVKFADKQSLFRDGNLCLTDGFMCGSCGYETYKNSPYCPHCGAKMDGEET